MSRLGGIHRRRACFPRTRGDEPGAGLVNFGMIITGSTMSADPDEFRRMTHSIESLSAASQLLVRPAYGRQEEAFIMALPLGVLPKNGGWA